MKHLQSLPASTTRGAKRVGRGYGSGKGSHTSTRGTKGQHARGSRKVSLRFEGGQLPLVKRLPMQRGKGRLKVLHPVLTVTLDDLQKHPAGEVTLQSLIDHKIIHRTTKKVKIVATGTLTKKLQLVGITMSAKAKSVIENT